MQHAGVALDFGCNSSGMSRALVKSHNQIAEMAIELKEAKSYSGESK